MTEFVKKRGSPIVQPDSLEEHQNKMAMLMLLKRLSQLEARVNELELINREKEPNHEILQAADNRDRHEDPN